MSYTLAISTNQSYRELRLPVLDNANYEILLRAGEYELQRDVLLLLEVVDSGWKFRSAPDYQIYCCGQPFE